MAGASPGCSPAAPLAAPWLHTGCFWLIPGCSIVSFRFSWLFPGCSLAVFRLLRRCSWLLSAASWLLVAAPWRFYGCFLAAPGSTLLASGCSWLLPGHTIMAHLRRDRTHMHTNTSTLHACMHICLKKNPGAPLDV